MRPSPDATRVAFAGLGPKGLYALERLLSRAAGGDAGRLEVDIFEPHPEPGAGPVYETGQPDYLRMNFAVEQIDAWERRDGAVPEQSRLSLKDWLAADGGHPARYPPRSHVGAYLKEVLELVTAHAPDHASVQIHPLSVDRIDAARPAWRLTREDGRTSLHDEVLLATGHAGWWAGSMRAAWSDTGLPVRDVFPVAGLTERVAAPSAAVAVRGFALTFIDAALALSEGRGGSFEDSGGTVPTYVRSGGEPLLLPFSRTGRPMLAKPDPDLAASIAGLDETFAVARERIAGFSDPLNLSEDVIDPLAGAAGAALLAANGADGSSESLRLAHEQIGARLRGPAASDAVDPAAVIRHSLEVGAGLAAPGEDWALGAAWRAIYPALVDRLGGAALPPTAWPRLRRLATEMERISFGPPALNAAKLVALLDAGVVEPAHLDGGSLKRDGDATLLVSAAGRTQVEAVIDAVLAPPGVAPGATGPLHGLLATGAVRIAEGRRGLETTAEGCCIGADGEVSEGLAAIGRPTEDWVIGNDTLSRTLHPNADAWARGVLRRCAIPTDPRLTAGAGELRS